MKPDPEWLPMAFLMPACLVLWAVAVIEGACDAWADEESEPGAADVSRDPHRPTPSGLQPVRLAQRDRTAGGAA